MNEGDALLAEVRLTCILLYSNWATPSGRFAIYLWEAAWGGSEEGNEEVRERRLTGRTFGEIDAEKEGPGETRKQKQKQQSLFYPCEHHGGVPTAGAGELEMSALLRRQ